MITGKNIFQIVLEDHERKMLLGELKDLLPDLTHATAKQFPILYQIRAESREYGE